VDPSQLEQCAEKPDGEPCMAVGVDDGHCKDQVCLATVCGDSIQEFGEMCDDGNTVDDDVCSADCVSDMTCGNGHTDSFMMKEQCDDGGRLSHDGCSSQCKLERARWIEHTITPGKRHGAAFAYDSLRGRLVVFGGEQYDGSPFERNDTIEWDGIDWSRMPTEGGPSARVDSAMAFDAARGESVLFGGFDGQHEVTDTWVWNGLEWRSVNVGGPARRFAHAMAFDPVRKVIVLFGGFYQGSAAGDPDRYLDDTWEWDGATWTQVTTAAASTPPGRVGAAMAFDPKLGKILMVGGSVNDTNGNPINFDDMWTYDGTWTPVTVVGSKPVVAYAGLTYDVKNQRIVLHGGYSTGTGAELGAMWAWNGTTWTNLGAQSPLARGSHVFVNVGDSIVMSAGRQGSGVTDALGDTFIYNGTSWSPPGDMGTRQYAAATNDFVHARVLAFGGLNASNVAQNSLWAITRSGMKSLATGPTARAGMAFAYNPLQDELLLFGGRSGGLGTSIGETWEGRDNFNWNQRTAGTQPTPRSDAGLAFDGSKMIMFGGFTTASTNETWAYDGSAWTNLGANGPSARTEAAVGYDPVRKQVLMFGGNGADYLHDTWAWDGTAWLPAAQNQFSPPPGFGGTLTWNPARQRLTLTGSQVTGGFEAFEWDGQRWEDVAAANEPVNRFGQLAFTSLSGAGIQIWGGYTYSSFTTIYDRWELRWDANHPDERCDQQDSDKDGLKGCADPDCWPICTPLCMPGMGDCGTVGTRCGDGTCDADRESCQTCPEDCNGTMCVALCGNFVCDTGETGCPGDCPM
jgi:cysteine-rich repeat protein